MAGLAATSAINQQPWHFVAVTNREIIDEIKDSAGSFGGAPAGGKSDGTPAGDKPEGTPAGDYRHE